MRQNPNFIGVDIGASKMRVALGDNKGIHEKLVEDTDKEHGPEGIPLQISRMIHILVDSPCPIGIGSIGPIDLKKGMITNTPNYPFDNIPIKRPLESEFGVKVKIINDCAAAVIGERVFGAGKNSRNIFYVTLSTGLGGGAIVDDHLLLGKDGNAVEIGHFTLEPDSNILCGCGSPGHWEAFCGGNNIPNFARIRIKNVNLKGSLLNALIRGNPINLTAKILFDAASQGDTIALDIVEEIGKLNTVGFANIVNAFDPEIITVGGSITLNNPDLVLSPIKQNISRYLINREPEIILTPLGENVVLNGALAIAMNDRYVD
jgi:glucokinase